MELDEVRLLTVKEVARRLTVSVRTVREYIKRGLLRVIRLGRAVRVTEQDLAAFVATLRS